jgi:hypothetical protein
LDLRRHRPIESKHEPRKTAVGRDGDRTVHPPGRDCRRSGEQRKQRGKSGAERAGSVRAKGRSRHAQVPAGEFEPVMAA